METTEEKEEDSQKAKRPGRARGDGQRAAREGAEPTRVVRKSDGDADVGLSLSPGYAALT